MDPEECLQPMMEPSQWLTVLSTGALILNTILTVVTHNSVPMPQSQRRLFAATTTNFVILSGFQLAQNFFLYLAIQRPCLNQATTLSCKLQYFPLLFCYIHSAVSIFFLCFQTLFLKKSPKDKAAIVWSSSCSVWQSSIAAFCAAGTLVFTAFDKDNENRKMAKCSVLLAVRNTTLSFWLLTTLILIHLAAVIVIFFSSHKQNKNKTWIAFTVFSIKELLKIETFFWHLCLFVSGCVILYRHIYRTASEERLHFLLEISFIIIPLLIAFCHPLLLIWYILPIRDAATSTFPCMESFLPEYTLVPPQLPTASTSYNSAFATSPRTETTMSCDEDKSTITLKNLSGSSKTDFETS